MTLIFDPQWTFLDAARLGPLLRKADVQECAALGYSPVEGLHESLCNSNPGEAWVLKDDGGTLLGACGGARHRPGEGDPNEVAPWLLGTDALNLRHRRDFLTTIPRFLRKVSAGDCTFRGLMDARNVLHRKWCERLGFTFHAPVPAGPYGLPFLPFTLEKQPTCNSERSP